MAPSTDFAPRIDTLSNGVTLLNAPSGSLNVGVFLIVRAGSRDEKRETAGLAHFLEHMFFKGTKNRPTTKHIAREIDRLGAANNAYTDTEEVGYYAEGPATATGELADIICDMMARPLFNGKEMDRERNVVIQELAARLMDPDGWIWDRISMVAYGGDQPMSWSAAGFASVIESVSRDELVAYHQSFYSPSSMALVVAGGEQMGVEEAEKLVADFPSASARPRVPAVWGQGDRYIANVRPVTADEEPQIKFSFAMPGISATDDDRVALSVMTHILGGGMSSRLFNTVRERNGLCYSIFAHHEGYEDSGLFAIYTGTRPQDAQRSIELSFEEFRKLGAELVDEDELGAAKSAMVGRLLRGTETAMALARYYGTRWRARLPLETPAQRAEAIARVTAKDVQAVAQRILATAGDVRLAFVGPEDSGDRLLEATGEAAARA